MKIKTDKYDRRFAKLIKLRDCGTCQWCGKMHGKMDTSHLFSRRHINLRWDTRNACLKCFNCHIERWHGNPCEGREWLIGVIGAVAYDKLRLMANTTSKAPTQWEMDDMYREMAEEINHLEATPESDRWKGQFRYRYKGAL